MTGSSTQAIKTVLHPVSDLATAKAVYAALLGVPPQTDGSYYVTRSRPSLVATPSIGSPTTAMPGWPVPRRTVRRICR
jgi:hypothetical protein